MQPDDPLRQLEEWGRQVDRRVSRAHRLGRLTAALTRPGRAVRPAGGGRHRLVATVLIVAIAGALWLTRPNWARWDRPAGADRAAPYPRNAHPSGAFATTTASARPTGPFEGTPAATYPRGEAGFAMPAATDLDGWPRQRVADALDRVRQALTAFYLDRRTLVDHDPAALAAPLGPNAAALIRADFAKPADAGLTLISPTVRLAAEPPRVTGRTTVTTGRDETGRVNLDVVTNYVVVYPFDVPDRGPGSRVVVTHKEIIWRVYQPDQVAAADEGLWMYDLHGYEYGMDCVEARKGLLAPGHKEVTGPDLRPGDAADGYYDPNRSVEIHGGCDPAGPAPTSRR